MRRSNGLSGQITANPAGSQFLESGPAALPLLPEEAADTATNPFIEALQHAWGFAETKVATPASEISLQRTNYLVDADASRALSLCQFPDPFLEASQCLGCDAPFDLFPVREGKTQKLPRVWWRDRAFRIVDRQLELASEEGFEAHHHSLASAFAAYVDVTIVGVPHEPQSALLKQLIKIVEHQIG